MMLRNKFISLFIVSISLVFSFTDNPVKYDIHFSKDRIAPGDDFTIDIDIKIDSGFLIYSPNPLNIVSQNTDYTSPISHPVYPASESVLILLHVGLTNSILTFYKIPPIIYEINVAIVNS